MSILKCNRLENTSTASGGLDVDTSGKVRITTLADSAGNNDSTPAEIASGRAKAWVNFNGTGTVAIRSSFNVASITDNGTGDYTVNFTTAMADTNYATVGVSSLNATGSGSGRSANCFNPRDLATSSVRLYIVDGTSGSYTDVAVSNVAIFR